MSAPAAGSGSTAKLQSKDQSSTEPANEPQKNVTTLEDDDEFEDFPVEDWPEEDAQVPGENAHLWEESWDDDDTNEDFSKQLKAELEKMKGNK